MNAKMPANIAMSRTSTNTLNTPALTESPEPEMDDDEDSDEELEELEHALDVIEALDPFKYVKSAAFDVELDRDRNLVLLHGRFLQINAADTLFDGELGRIRMKTAFPRKDVHFEAVAVSNQLEVAVTLTVTAHGLIECKNENTNIAGKPSDEWTLDLEGIQYDLGHQMENDPVSPYVSDNE